MEPGVVSAQLAAVAVVLMAALLAAEGVQPPAAVVVLAVAVGLRAVPAAHLPLKRSGAVEPGLALQQLRQWEDAAVPQRQADCLRQAQVVAEAERAFPVEKALRALAAWARQQWEMLPGPVAAAALAPMARIDAPILDAALVGAAALSQFGLSGQTRLLTLPELVAR